MLKRSKQIKEHPLKQNFENQQKQFLEAFKNFDFKDNFFLSARFTCDYYRGEEFSLVLNSMPIEFVTTVFCDALLNSALFQLNTTLLETLSREHFVYNCYNVFNHDCNITNRHPQQFFAFLAPKKDPKVFDKIYATTLAYFSYVFPLLSDSVGQEKARKLLLSLESDSDLLFEIKNLEPEIMKAYMRGISDSLENLGLKVIHRA